ncbi:ABC transporter permease [Amaricoccus tamworthensis]|uniref:ABC transporter permease n=1 Tax=Amaricoccus tamworthensis TaxID=57002 RepID=UPI003C7A7786
MTGRFRKALHDNWISILTVLALIAGWQIAGMLSPTSPLRESPIVPPWEFIFGRALIGLSDYWRIDLWAPVPQFGGQQTLLGAVLAIGFHSALTLFRLIAGLCLGAIVGTLLGLALSWSEPVRRLLAPTLHLVRMIPLLALVPLFQFWFGSSNMSAIGFVGYGVGVIYLVATVNAVSNVPSRYVEAARTMGASKLRTYRTVIVPAILPELFSSIFLTLGLAWSAVIGAEFIGVESGIGRMIIWSDYFSNTGRMALITLIILGYAMISFALVARLQAWVLRWLPQQGQSRGRAVARGGAAAEKRQKK